MNSESSLLRILDPNLAQPLYEDLCQRFNTPGKTQGTQIDLEYVFHDIQIAPQQNLEQMCSLASRYFLYFSRRRPLPFHNLKMGLALTLTFLRLNEIELTAKEIELYQVALDTAYQELSPAEFSSFLFSHVSSNSPNSIWTLQTTET